MTRVRADPLHIALAALTVANLFVWGALAAVDVFGVTVWLHVPAAVLRAFPKG